MNAFAQVLENTQTDAITVKLIGQNFTTGADYIGRPIPVDFFAQALEVGHEIEVQSLTINGFEFYGSHISGYKEINAFLERLNEEDYSEDLAVIHAVLMERGLTDLDEVFDYVESKVLAVCLDKEELGLSDLREQYGQECSENALEAICDHLPTDDLKDLARHNWNHQGYIETMFINDCKFIQRGKVQVILSNR